MTQVQVEQSTNAQDSPAEQKLVPVGESIKYRRRAQQAENKAQQLEQELNDLKSQVERRNAELAVAEAQRDEARLQVATVENQRLAERMFIEAGVVDLEAASLLLSKRVDLSEHLDGETLARSVEQLLLDKPFLARRASPLPPATASARPERPGTFAQLAQAADRAARTGDRHDVAEYLRLRRQGASAARHAGGR